MNRRSFTKYLSCFSLSLALKPLQLHAKTYLTIEEAKKILCGNAKMEKVSVVLTKAQMKSIKKHSKTRVRNSVLKVWRVEDKGWFIVDQVIGKHENIDMAVALTKDGKVTGIEILVYRETYGHEIRNDKWRVQFYGRDSSEVLKLDKQIKNISGATLSCRHVTDGINRLTHTWEQVLRNL